MGEVIEKRAKNWSNQRGYAWLGRGVTGTQTIGYGVNSASVLNAVEIEYSNYAASAIADLR